MESELFILSLVSKLKQEEEEQHGEVVEREAILKLQKMRNMEMQKKACEDAENKINRIIEERLKKLLNS